MFRLVLTSVSVLLKRVIIFALMLQTLSLVKKKFDVSFSSLPVLPQQLVTYHLLTLGQYIHAEVRFAFALEHYYFGLFQMVKKVSYKMLRRIDILIQIMHDDGVTLNDVQKNQDMGCNP